MQNVPLFPEQASNVAGQVDAFYLFLVLITTFFSLLIALMILFFIIKYRKSPEREAEQIHGSTLLEVVWTVIPLAISMVIFVWGAWLYYHLQRPPADSLYRLSSSNQCPPRTEKERKRIAASIGRPVESSSSRAKWQEFG